MKKIQKRILKRSGVGTAIFVGWMALGWFGCGLSAGVDPHGSDIPTDSEPCETGGECSPGPGIFDDNGLAAIDVRFEATCAGKDSFLDNVCAKPVVIGLKLIMTRDGDTARGALCSTDDRGWTRRCAAATGAVDEGTLTIHGVELDYNLGFGGDLMTLDISRLYLKSWDAGLEVVLSGEAGFLFDDILVFGSVEASEWTFPDEVAPEWNIEKTVLIGLQPLEIQLSEPVACSSLPLDGMTEGPSNEPLAQADCDKLPGLPGYTLKVLFAPMGAMWTPGQHAVFLPAFRDAAENTTEGFETVVDVPAIDSSSNLGFELPVASTWLLQGCHLSAAIDGFQPVEGQSLALCDNGAAFAGLLQVPAGATALALQISNDGDGYDPARVTLSLHSDAGAGEPLTVELAPREDEPLTFAWQKLTLPLPPGQERIALFVTNPDNGSCGECPPPWRIAVDDVRFE